MLNYYDYEERMYQCYNSLQPQSVKGQNNVEARFHRRYLYNKIESCLDFDFKSLNWDLNAFRFLLLRFGSVCIFNHPKYGWVFGCWSPRTQHIYFNPSTWTFQFINYSAVNDGVELIGDDTNSVIVKMFDDFLGFDDLVASYSVKLALLDRLIETASMNANVNLVAYAKSKKEAETIKTAYSQATKGEPLVLINRNIKDKLSENEHLLEPFTNHDTALSMDRLLTSRRTILNSFLTEIGIKNANFQKKERLITDEVNSNNEEVSSNITIAYDNIKKGFDKFNALSGIGITVDLHYDYEVDNDIDVTGGEEE